MKPRRLSDWILVGLSLLVVVQVALFASRRASPDLPAIPPPAFIVPGDWLGDVTVILAGDRSEPLVSPSEDRPTLVMAFHSECAHCATVAPAWREWLESTSTPSLRVLGLVREPLETAQAYAHQHGWSLEIVRVPDDPMAEGFRLVTRTPWLILLDADGVVRFEGHGSKLDELEPLLAELTPSTTRSGP
jgi:hypothetical protein